MRKTFFAGAAIVALSLSLTACSAPSTADTSSPSAATSSSAPTTKTDDRTGTFAGLNGKKVAGTVSFQDGNLVLSGFSSDEGPDLHVYLANGTDEATVTAGKEIKGVSFDTASQKISLGGVDTAGFAYVVVHCDKAKAVFGAAPLS
ncbi:MAG: DM13 domain-containing protein [Leifsonia sp.]|jgi:hypothetical protein|nr:DM13 domain-containing protein [Leifsonia sp.]